MDRCDRAASSSVEDSVLTHECKFQGICFDVLPFISVTRVRSGEKKLPLAWNLINLIPILSIFAKS